MAELEAEAKVEFNMVLETQVIDFLDQELMVMEVEVEQVVQIKMVKEVVEVLLLFDILFLSLLLSQLEMLSIMSLAKIESTFGLATEHYSLFEHK